MKKKIFAGAIIFAAAVCIAGRIFLQSIYVLPILMYHSIGGEGGVLNVPVEYFRRQMKFLSDGRYNVITLKEAVDYILEDKPIPRKSLVLTFDDGLENNYTDAYPALKEYGLPAAMFVIPGHCADEGYLSRAQIKEMSENGILMGSHTLTDTWLPGCDDAELKRELAGSKAAIEEITGRPVNFISYPLGGFNDRVRVAAMKAGYKGACAVKPGRFSSPRDIYALKRLKVSGKNADRMIAFWFKTTGYYTWFVERKLEKRARITTNKLDTN